MEDAVSAARLRGTTPPPYVPSRASHFFAFTARLGTFLVASALGTAWLFTLFVGALDFIPYTSRTSWWPLVIGLMLSAVLTGGVWFVGAVRRTRAELVRSLGGLLVALACGASMLALITLVPQTNYGFLLTSGWAGAIAIVVTYVVSGLRDAPPPYQRYVSLGYGVASWVVLTAFILVGADQGFSIVALCGLPLAALGGLAGGALQRAFLGSTAPRRRSRAPEEQREFGVRDAPGQPGQAAPEAAPRAASRLAASHGLAWRLIAAGLLGLCAPPFGPEEPVTLWLSLLALGCFAGIALVLDLSLLGWRPGLLALLGSVIAIVWGGGGAIVQTTGPLLFALPMGAAARTSFVAFVGLCAVLCLLAVEGAHWEERPGSGERRMLGQLAWPVVMWLAAGLSCWLGIAVMMLLRGWPGMPMGSESPGQTPLAAALPLVLLSLPAALLGALVGGAARWASLRATAHRPFRSFSS